MKFSAFDEAAMRRALELARAGCTAHIRIRASARCWRATRKSSAKAGTNAPGEPHAEPICHPRRGRARARRHGLRHARTLQPSRAHAALRGCAARGRRAPRGVRGRRSESARERRGCGAPEGSRRRRSSPGLLEREAEALNAGFMMRMREGRPFVRLKSAASLDGRTALANGKSKWITSEAARADVQHWRAQSGAVLTSAATVLADDPRLDVRIETPRQPLRVVLDRRRVRKSARILAPPGEVLLFAANPRRNRGAPSRTVWRGTHRARARIARPSRSRARVRAPGRTRDQRGAGGSRPAADRRVAAAGLVDEWLIYLAPLLLGSHARPLAALPPVTRIAAARRFELYESTQIGPDLRLRLRQAR